MYGKEAKIPIDETNNNTRNFDEQINLLSRKVELFKVEEVRIKAKEIITQKQEKQIQKRREEIKKETKFLIGEKVLLKESSKEKQWTGKLSQNWKGPYYIHEIFGRGAYKLKTIDGKIIKASQNVKNLKRYYDKRDVLPTIFIE